MGLAQNEKTPVWLLQAVQKWKDADTRTFGPPSNPEFSLDPRNPNMVADTRRYLETDPLIAKFNARKAQRVAMEYAQRAAR